MDTLRYLHLDDESQVPESVVDLEEAIGVLEQLRDVDRFGGTVTAGEYAPCENEYANVAIVTVGIELQVISRGHRDRASREPHVAARSMLLFLHAGPDCRCRWPARAAYRPGTGS